jgi:hypothetical protein
VFVLPHEKRELPKGILMKHYIFAAVLLAFSLSAQAFQPRTGHWNNLNEPGRGFNIDVQDGVMVLTMYSYDSGGNPQWYIASGNMTNGQRGFSASLDKFRNGQCLSCGFTPPVSAGSDGAIFVTFATETSATVTLPGGAMTHIVPFNFKYGDPPLGMLGSWVFTEQLGSTGFADAYSYTKVKPTSSADGSGQLVTDSAGTAGCEYEIRGTFAGKVICVHGLNASGSSLEGYFFQYGLDETFDGQYLSSSGTLYPMKGFRTGSASGFTKSLNKEGPSLKSLVDYTDAPNAPAEMVNALRELATRITSMKQQ